LAWLVAQAGRVDILVNSVGIFWPVPFLDISDQDWFHIFEVNVMSGVRLSSRAFASNAEAQLGPHHFCLQ
jgi:NAD(P)-dependent dehydrogenase (short-subunit alcohol dehydrogenase family)